MYKNEQRSSAKTSKESIIKISTTVPSVLNDWYKIDQNLASRLSYSFSPNWHKNIVIWVKTGGVSWSKVLAMSYWYWFIWFVYIFGLVHISGRYLIILNLFLSGLIILIWYSDDYFDIFCLSELSLCLSHLIIVCPNRFILCLVSVYSRPLP